MNFFPLAKIVGWLVAYRYLVLFPAAVVEGPIITIIAGFLCSLGVFDFFTTYVILVGGDLVGDTLYYSIGYFGRAGFINRWGHYIGLNQNRVATIEKHFHNHSGKTLFAGKCTQVAGIAILVAAGAAKMRYYKFMGFCLLATIPKSLLLLLAGYYFGQAYAEINHYFNNITIAVVIIMGIAAIITIGLLQYQKIVKKKFNGL